MYKGHERQQEVTKQKIVIKVIPVTRRFFQEQLKQITFTHQNLQALSSSPKYLYKRTSVTDNWIFSDVGNHQNLGEARIAVCKSVHSRVAVCVFTDDIDTKKKI